MTLSFPLAGYSRRFVVAVGALVLTAIFVSAALHPLHTHAMSTLDDFRVVHMDTIGNTTTTIRF